MRQERGLGPLFPGHRESDGWEWVPPFLLLGLALLDLTSGCMCTRDSVVAISFRIYYAPLFLKWGFLYCRLASDLLCHLELLHFLPPPLPLHTMLVLQMCAINPVVLGFEPRASCMLDKHPIS